MKIENFDTQYAHFEGEDIYISRAESGRRGYTCIGCKRPLEAVIQRKNPEHKSYFRHIIDPREKQNFHCSFESKKYLERVVEKIIIEEGSILLPKVVKYPPQGSYNVPLLLREENVLIPAKIVAQQIIFLKEGIEDKPSTDDSSQVKKKHIRPDVVFYDENGGPILFIEIIITHPIDDVKKAKLINKGIDTIQVALPHGDKDELKEIIEAGTNTKWVFNNEEFYTDYFSITGENRKELPSINEQQRSLFQESSTCRRARIRELIQSIERCMETGEFLAIEKNFRAEISRIEELTKVAKSRLGKMEAEQEAGLYSEFEPEESSLREAEKKERAESHKIESKQKELEARYTTKAEKLREEESAIRRRERDVFGAENPLGELPRRINAVSGDINRLQGKYGKNQAEENEISDEERRIDEQLAEYARIEERVYG